MLRAQSTAKFKSTMQHTAKDNLKWLNPAHHLHRPKCQLLYIGKFKFARYAGLIMDWAKSNARPEYFKGMQYTGWRGCYLCIEV